MQNEVCVIERHRPEWIEPRVGPQLGPAWICAGRAEFHHVKPYGGGITGSKVSDRRGIKLCAKHHALAEQGRLPFERSFALNLDDEIERLNREYPAEAQPKPPRQPKPKAKIHIEHCVCRRSHDLGFSKLDVTGSFQCPITNERVTAERVL